MQDRKPNRRPSRHPCAPRTCAGVGCLGKCKSSILSGFSQGERLPVVRQLVWRFSGGNGNLPRPSLLEDAIASGKNAVLASRCLSPGAIGHPDFRNLASLGPTAPGKRPSGEYQLHFQEGKGRLWCWRYIVKQPTRGQRLPSATSLLQLPRLNLCRGRLTVLLWTRGIWRRQANSRSNTQRLYAIRPSHSARRARECAASPPATSP
jgi:hypothetical protein